MANRIGKVAVEEVEGTFESGRLELCGDKVDKPDLKWHGEYTIEMHTNGTRFEGKFRAHKPYQNIEGDVLGDVSIRP
jgi:hypothetical protein